MTNFVMTVNGTTAFGVSYLAEVAEKFISYKFNTIRHHMIFNWIHNVAKRNRDYFEVNRNSVINNGKTIGGNILRIGHTKIYVITQVGIRNFFRSVGITSNSKLDKIIAAFFASFFQKGKEKIEVAQSTSPQYTKTITTFMNAISNLWTGGNNNKSKNTKTRTIKSISSGIVQNLPNLHVLKKQILNNQTIVNFVTYFDNKNKNWTTVPVFCH